MEIKDDGEAFAMWLVTHPGSASETDKEKLKMIFELMKNMPDLMKVWAEETEKGKEWLSGVAADVGVPLQIALPFGGAQKH